MAKKRSKKRKVAKTTGIALIPTAIAAYPILKFLEASNMVNAITSGTFGDMPQRILNGMNNSEVKKAAVMSIAAATGLAMIRGVVRSPSIKLGKFRVRTV